MTHFQEITYVNSCATLPKSLSLKEIKEWVERSPEYQDNLWDLESQVKHGTIEGYKVEVSKSWLHDLQELYEEDKQKEFNELMATPNIDVYIKPIRVVEELKIEFVRGDSGDVDFG